MVQHLPLLKRAVTQLPGYKLIKLPYMDQPNKPEGYPKEEDAFDFSVLFQEDQPSAFTIPHIIEMVILFIILIVSIVKK